MASFKSYLSNNASFLNAREKWNTAGGVLADAKRKWQDAKESDANYAQILAAYNTAKEQFATAERAKNLAESDAKVAFDKADTAKQIAEQKKKDAEIQKQIDAVQTDITKYTNAQQEVPADKQAKLDKLQTKLTGAPQGPKTDTNTRINLGGSGTNAPGGVEDAVKIIEDLFKPENQTALIAMQKSLKKFGYNGPADGSWSQDFQTAYDNAQKLRASAPTPLKGASLISFIQNPVGINLSSVGGGNTPYGTISDPTQAAGYVRSVFKSVLEREPTAEEITKYSSVLKKAQQSNLKRTVNGITTGGLDNPLEFLTQEIQKLPEFETKKKDKDTLITQDIQSVARANGITLGADQLASYATDVRNGKDINTIKNDIRNSAGNGLPDNIKKMLENGTNLETIYAPYKSTMASLLELNPTDISLEDPTLRAAIGPDKEMPLYEFRKALKKDARWQYTNNAKAEISDKVLRVLQDFGFQA